MTQLTVVGVGSPTENQGSVWLGWSVIPGAAPSRDHRHLITWLGILQLMSVSGPGPGPSCSSSQDPSQESENPPPNTSLSYELRVIIWNMEDVVLDDVNRLTGEMSSDIYEKR